MIKIFERLSMKEINDYIMKSDIKAKDVLNIERQFLDGQYLYVLYYCGELV